MTQTNYRPTVVACFIGFVVQAVSINFTSLLFVSFGTEYGLSLSQISSLIAVCFGAQLLTDALAAKFSDKMHPRASVVSANVLAAVGIAGLGILPNVLPPYVGLLVATVLSGTGSGLVEVMLSPIVEACPSKRKSAMMSLLHSFYCWGHAAVVLFSSIFFVTVGIENWNVLTFLWALIPFGNAILFLFVPIPVPESGKSANKKDSFLRNPMFWAVVGIMMCAGASEMTMAQWASNFAETGLGVSKTLGDLLGPFMFALLMGSARVFYARFSSRISLSKFMTASGILCAVTYIVAALAPHPIIALLGCGLCGLSVGIMWPGGFSTAAGNIPHGGVSMFALLALAGDMGCLAGPTIVGTLSDLFGGNLRISLLLSIVFPLLLVAFLLYLSARKKKEKSQRKA